MSKFDESLARMKGWLASPLSKIEGTFSMFNLRSVAQESAFLQNEMEIVRDNYSLDSASGEYLDKKASDEGMTRKYAQPAHGTVTFTGVKDTIIPLGTVVLAPDYGVRFVTIEVGTIGEGGTVSVDVQCESTGASGNVPIGAVNKLAQPVAGVSAVTNEAEMIDGVDRESDEAFRSRIYIKCRYPATSGNKQCYVNWASEVSGVGAVKVFSKKDMMDLGMDVSKYNVRVSILGGEKAPASPELVQQVKDYLDPTGGGGDGVAPVGAVVEVTTAKEKVVNVSAKVSLGTLAGNVEAVKAAFTEVLEAYFAEIAYDGKTEGVSPAQIGYRLLDVAGVVDYAEMTLNGGTAAVTIGAEEVLKVGTVTLTTAGGGA